MTLVDFWENSAYCSKHPWPYLNEHIKKKLVIKAACHFNLCISSCVFLTNGTVLTFYNINHTEAKQRRYMVGSGCVNCDRTTHAVANHQDRRRRVAIEHLHYFADIPLEGQNTKLVYVGAEMRNEVPDLQNNQYWSAQYELCRHCRLNGMQWLTWPLCLLRDHLGFSLWSHLPEREKGHITVCTLHIYDKAVWRHLSPKASYVSTTTTLTTAWFVTINQLYMNHN